ncbi:MAG: hypothetical protein ABIG20_00290 [archaeon]
MGDKRDLLVLLTKIYKAGKDGYTGFTEEFEELDEEFQKLMKKIFKDKMHTDSTASKCWTVVNNIRNMGSCSMDPRRDWLEESKQLIRELKDELKD